MTGIFTLKDETKQKITTGSFGEANQDGTYNLHFD